MTSAVMILTSMPENWKPYLCNVNGKLASILVDLGLREKVPIAYKSWLLWTCVYFRWPRADGLSDGKETPTLWKIEDALSESVSRTCKAIPCGRITTEGRREFYFYGESKHGFREAVRSALNGFQGYKFDLGEREDSLWGQYLDVLYPSPENLQRIANMDVLDLLEKQGDIHTVPREVQHRLYFPSEPSRALFRNAARGAGFSILSESSVEGELPFGISVARTQSIEQAVIDDTVLELLRLAERFGGDYDGWETPAVTQ